MGPLVMVVGPWYLILDIGDQINIQINYGNVQTLKHVLVHQRLPQSYIIKDNVLRVTMEICAMLEIMDSLELLIINDKNVVNLRKIL